MKIYYRLILSRKEANIRLPNNLETEGDYGEKGYVWQAFCGMVQKATKLD